MTVCSTRQIRKYPTKNCTPRTHPPQRFIRALSHHTFTPAPRPVAVKGATHVLTISRNLYQKWHKLRSMFDWGRLPQGGAATELVSNFYDNWNKVNKKGIKLLLFLKIPYLSRRSSYLCLQNKHFISNVPSNFAPPLVPLSSILSILLTIIFFPSLVHAILFVF
jgi:hypothetical protein